MYEISPSVLTTSVHRRNQAAQKEFAARMIQQFEEPTHNKHLAAAGRLLPHGDDGPRA